MSALLEVSNLEVAYGPSQVLYGLNLAMAEGEAATPARPQWHGQDDDAARHLRPAGDQGRQHPFRR
jgi:hypothetical protein